MKALKTEKGRKSNLNRVGVIVKTREGEEEGEKGGRRRKKRRKEYMYLFFFSFFLLSLLPPVLFLFKNWQIQDAGRGGVLDWWGKRK